MDAVAHLAEDSDEDFSGLPTLEDKNGHDKVKKPEDEEVEEKAPEKDTNNKGNSSVVTDDDGWEDVLGSGRLKKRIVKNGEDKGVKPGKGTRVRVKVEERVLGGLVVMQETSIEFNVGESEVLQCLDLVLPLMCKGEVAEVTSEHSFAYGLKGDGDRVAPSTDLQLLVTLEGLQELAAPPDIPLEERARIGNLKRERGNRWYARGENSLAVQCYRKAAEYLDDKQIEEDMEVPIDRFLLPKDIQQLLEDRVKTFNNMAQAQMKLTAWDTAMASIRQVLRIQPNNEKALFRKAKILQEKHQLDEAIGILRRINRLYPANKQCHTELANLTNKVKASRSAEQNMSRKMLGLDNAPIEASSGFFSKHVKVALAALGGLGALAGAYLVKQYNVQ